MQNQRIRYLDYLRVISMLAVVFLHSFYIALPQFQETDSLVWGVLFYSLKDCGRFAVPVFCMMTGALFLNPRRELTYKKLFSKYILKYGLIILIFVWGYAFAKEVLNTHTVSLNAMWTCLVRTVSGEAKEHIYYLYDLIGMMLIMPLLKKGIDRFDQKDIRYAVCVLFVFVSVLPTLKKLTGFTFGISLPVTGVYVLYLLLGWWIHNGNIVIREKVCLLLIAVMILFCFADGYLNMVRHVDLWPYAYSSPVCVIFACSVFCLVKQRVERSEAQETGRVVRTLSKYSFLIYIFHLYLQVLTLRFLQINVFATPVPVITSLLLAVSSLGLSMAIGFVLEKIPPAKHLLF